MVTATDRPNFQVVLPDGTRKELVLTADQLAIWEQVRADMAALSPGWLQRPILTSSTFPEDFWCLAGPMPEKPKP